MGVLPTDGAKAPHRQDRTGRVGNYTATSEEFLVAAVSRSWPSKAELRTEVFEYIEVFFNRRRRHSTLGYLSPEQFENQKTREIEMIKPTAAAAA